MPTIINEFDFTTEQLNYFESEMRKYKVPFLYKIVMGALYKAGAIFVPLLVVLVAVLGLTVGFESAKIVGLITILGIGVPLTIAWIWNQLKTRVARKKLGLTKYQWNTLVVAFGLKFI